MVKILAPVAILAVFIAVILAIPENEEASTANSNAAGTDVSALQVGDMAKLVVHETPFNEMTTIFANGEGEPMTVADMRGKVVVMNFWATWCAPCRAEMPSIDRLAGELNGEDIHVMAVSTDRGDRARIDGFFQEVEIQHLGVYRDQKSELAREAGAFGLPMTIIIGRDGREIARLLGEAEWDSAEAKAIIRRLAEQEG
ncbi:MAG: TlpA disulfide reductase family protein [Pseudomonadota bacterium]